MTEAWQIGGYRTDTLTGKDVKCGVALGAALSNAGVCFQVLGANYQVSAGKTFKITGIIPIYMNSTAGNIQLRSADDAALTTNPVAVGFGFPRNATIAAGNFSNFLSLVGLSVPAGKYVGIFETAGVGTSCTAMIIGYEE